MQAGIPMQAEPLSIWHGPFGSARRQVPGKEFSQLPETIFIDGKFHSRAQAKVSVFDHGLLYGDGVFEGIRLYDGCIFRFDGHLKRLFSSAKYLAMKIPMTFDEL